MTVTTKQSVYDGISNNPRYVYTVSREAVQEKRRNWREIYGVGEGSALVSHPDWQMVLDHATEVNNNLTGALVHCVDDNGKIAHIGVISSVPSGIRLVG